MFLGVGCPSIRGGVLTRGVPPGVAAPSSITHHKPDKDDDYGDDGDEGDVDKLVTKIMMLVIEKKGN